MAMLSNCSVDIRGVDVALVRFAWCISYLEGFRDALTAGREEVGQRSAPCLPQGVSGQQVLRLVVRWLEDHPAELHNHYRSLTARALRDGLPCK